MKYGLYFKNDLFALFSNKQEAIKTARKTTTPATVTELNIRIKDRQPVLTETGIIYENKAQRKINNR